MMKRTRVTVIGLAIVFLALSAAYAQGQEKYRQGGQGKKESIFKELKLTPEQEKKLEDNRKAQQQEMQDLREALKANHEKLQVKLKDPAVTRAAIEPLVNEIKSLQAKLIDHRINGIFAVKTILTPEQFAKFNEIMEKQMKAGKGRAKGAQDKPKGPPPEM
ncbi:MAG: Spy/CpxP family protein refolding chaperone [Candidatus Omnitrophica bacterium]|nr:Spy/CpxP family protein refolding chaperone [Candidatus Omnitrophota bacterium]